MKDCDRGHSADRPAKPVKKKLTEKNSHKRYCERAKNQSDCRIRYRARLAKNKSFYVWVELMPALSAKPPGIFHARA